MTGPRDTTRWVRRGGALAALLLGWLFIAWQNHFHVSAPMVFVGLAYLAVVATIYNLWRTGVAVVDADDEGDSTWAKPRGALGELEREKRTLVKAIKEAEFDLQMGKLSQRDADEMIRVYRARAIEVIKEIDRLGHGAAGSAREQIMREVRARLELEARSQKKAADAKPAKASKTDKARTKVNDAAVEAAADPAATPAVSEAEARAASALAAAERLDDAAPGAAPAAPELGDVPEPASAVIAPAARPMLDDEAMDADSTTTVEPARDDPAKEATP